MSFALATLKKLLGSNEIDNLGVVSAVTPTSVSVATPKGLVTCSYTNILKIGDKVCIQNNTAIKISEIQNVYRV